jgi:hypothetical protein
MTQFRQSFEVRAIYRTQNGTIALRTRAAESASLTERRVSAAAPPAAAADRAVNKAINRYAYAGDLLQDVENGSVKAESVKEDQLPDDLKKFSPEARKKEIARRIAERKAVRAEILTLSQKRDIFLRDAQKKKGGKSVGFDTVVADALRQQAAKKKIKL